MNDYVNFINNQILVTKATIFDYETAIKEEEKKLYNLHGALETIKTMEQAPKEE